MIVMGWPVGITEEGLAGLLGRPLHSRIRSDAEVKDTAPVVSQHQEDIQNPKPDRRHGEEVDRHYSLDVIVKEGMYLPTLVSPTSMPSLSSSPWMRGAPQSGFSRLSLRISSRTSLGSAGGQGSDFPSPEQPEALAVPGNDSLRLDDDQGRSPIAPNLA